MKQLLKELGFEHLPMLSEFVAVWQMPENKVKIPKEYRLLMFERNVIDYTLFITQPLTKGMFVPCVDGVVIDEPITEDNIIFSDEQYQQAKERVLFETDSNISAIFCKVNGKQRYQTIEQAINAGVKLTPKQ